MDAPLITLDDAANTTDVYAFVSQRFGRKYLTTALAVYPHEEPGIGPNKYNFDDDVLYEIRVATGEGRRQGAHHALLPVPVRHDLQEPQHDPAVVPRRHRQRGRRVAEPDSALHGGQGRLAHRERRSPRPRDRAAEQPGQRDAEIQPDGQRRAAGEGRRRRRSELDPYTSQSVATLEDGYLAFAGQRDDGFYADVQAIFDLLKLRPADKAVDSQGGFNVHTIALNIPIEELGGDQQIVGVYATTSRRRVRILASRRGRQLR